MLQESPTLAAFVFLSHVVPQPRVARLQLVHAVDSHMANTIKSLHCVPSWALLSPYLSVTFHSSENSILPLLPWHSYGLVLGKLLPPIFIRFYPLQSHFPLHIHTPEGPDLSSLSSFYIVLLSDFIITDYFKCHFELVTQMPFPACCWDPDLYIQLIFWSSPLGYPLSITTASLLFPPK